MRFGLNRLNMADAQSFAASAARAESLGWHAGLLPCNPLLAPDPYVSLALAAQQTQHLQLGTLLDTPVLRHPSVLAGSIATVARLAPERIQLGLGIGDTAVRFNGLAPATLRTLEENVAMVRALLAGERLEVGAEKPAWLRHAVPVPVWVAAQGPKTLRMAGRIADGVWIRVGTHSANLRSAWQAVSDGAAEAGRNLNSIRVGLIFHVALCDVPSDALLMGKAIAAGYYEYSPFLFDGPGLVWSGADPHSMRDHIYPDFLHHKDPVAAGRAVDFLDAAAADAFALYGSWPQINAQLHGALERARAAGIAAEIIVPHPVLPFQANVDYMHACATQLIPNFSEMTA